jgi:hypothetical protein
MPPKKIRDDHLEYIEDTLQQVSSPSNCVTSAHYGLSVWVFDGVLCHQQPIGEKYTDKYCIGIFLILFLLGPGSLGKGLKRDSQAGTMLHCTALALPLQFGAFKLQHRHCPSCWDMSPVNLLYSKPGSCCMCSSMSTRSCMRGCKYIKNVLHVCTKAVYNYVAPSLFSSIAQTYHTVH